VEGDTHQTSALSMASSVRSDLFSESYFSMNGNMCYFLKQEFIQTWNIFSLRLCLTKNHSIAVFSMSTTLRNRLAKEVNYFCSLKLQQSDQEVINQFKTPAVFLPLNHHTKFYIKRKNHPSQQVSKCNLPQCHAFSGIIILTINGVKVAGSTMEILPMMAVKQVHNESPS